MKFFIAVLIALTATAWADHHGMRDMEKMPFDQHKKMMQEMLTKKSTMIEECRKCVDEAKDNAALKECHSKMWEDKHAMMDEMHDKMKSTKKKQ